MQRADTGKEINMDTKQKKKKSAPGSKQRVTAAKKPAPNVPAPKKKKEQKVKSTKDIVYLPPKPFSRNRLMLHLATVAAVVLALVLGLSVFFKVDSDKITVSGAEKYTAWNIAQASGIQNGDNLLTFNRAKAAGKIKKALKYVKDVRIGIKLPDTVHIDIVEVSVTYAVKAQNGIWWLVSSEGRVIEKADESKIDTYTKVLGVQLEGPKEGEQAVAYQEPQTATDPEGNLVPVTVTAAERLSTALDVMGYLEKNGIIGQVASIDVNDIGGIQLWYGKQYQIELGDKKDLSLKIASLKSALDAYLKDHDSGVLDITDPPKVVYMSFGPIE